MQEKRFWICGKHSVLEMIKNNKRDIYEVLINKNIKININDQIFSRLKNKIKIVEDAYISRTIKNLTIKHQGYAALVSNIKNKWDLNEMQKSSLIIALDKVTDSRNIGSIIRTCAAFNVDGVILKEKDFKDSSLSMNKTACGGIEKINILKCSNIKYSINKLREIGFKIISFSSNSKKILNKDTFDKKNVLIFGSEDEGVSKLILEKSDEIIKIDTKNTDSLNVSNSVSAALSVYQFLKRFGK